MTPPVGVAMLGFPGAGKTTYLAALYSALDSPVSGAPRLLRQPTTRAYLEEIRDAWLGGQPVDRTPVGTGEIVDFAVGFDATEVLLRIPDVSGESFTEALVSRRIDAALAQVVRDSAGLLLFTHPAHLRHRVPIVRATEEGFVGPAKAAPTRDFDAAAAPTETQLVDLLQWAAWIRPSDQTLRVALVLSAWDEMRGMKPANILRQVPLLAAYLDCTSELIDAQVFGVSAQGGEYGGPQDPASTPPEERPYVVSASGERLNDITAPLRWAATGA